MPRTDARPSGAARPRPDTNRYQRPRNGRNPMFLDPSLARVVHAERAARWRRRPTSLGFSTGHRAGPSGRRSGARWSASAPGSPPTNRSTWPGPAEGPGHVEPPGDHLVDCPDPRAEGELRLRRTQLLPDQAVLGLGAGFLVYSVAGALSISLIGVEQGSADAAPVLMIGAIFWNYLSVVFSFIAETIAVERWEGTLEYTMMAPVRRWTQLLGSCSTPSSTASSTRPDPGRADAVLRARPDAGQLARPPRSSWPSARSASSGIGMMAAILPLLYVERGAQMTFVLQSCLLLVSGVYYSVDDPAAVDAGPVALLPGDVRPRRRPPRPDRRRRRSASCGTTSGRW